MVGGLVQRMCDQVDLSSLQSSRSPDVWSKFDVYLGNFGSATNAAMGMVSKTILLSREPCQLKASTCILLVRVLESEKCGLKALFAMLAFGSMMKDFPFADYAS